MASTTVEILSTSKRFLIVRLKASSTTVEILSTSKTGFRMWPRFYLQQQKFLVLPKTSTERKHILSTTVEILSTSKNLFLSSSKFISTTVEILSTSKNNEKLHKHRIYNSRNSQYFQKLHLGKCTINLQQQKFLVLPKALHDLIIKRSTTVEILSTSKIQFLVTESRGSTTVEILSTSKSLCKTASLVLSTTVEILSTSKSSDDKTGKGIYNSRNSQYFQKRSFSSSMFVSTTVEILSTSKSKICSSGAIDLQQQKFLVLPKD